MRKMNKCDILRRLNTIRHTVYHSPEYREWITQRGQKPFYPQEFYQFIRTQLPAVDRMVTDLLADLKERKQSLWREGMVADAHLLSGWQH